MITNNNDEKGENDHDLETISIHNDNESVSSGIHSNNSNNNEQEEEEENVTEVTLKRTPLPVKRIAAICVILFSESIVTSIIFPFVSFMVRDFGIAGNDESVGYYAGYLASAFFLGQFLSSFFWGWCSDRIGRRPVLLIGISGSIVSVLLFGFSSSYTMALLTRLFNGIINSNFTICRAYLGDITDSTNRVRAFSFVGLNWGFGTIFGPFLGGVLSNPAESLPFINVDSDDILGKYPYLLPTLVAAGIGALSLVLTIFLLPESKKFTKVEQVKMTIINSEENNIENDTTISKINEINDPKGERVIEGKTLLEKSTSIPQKSKSSPKIQPLWTRITNTIMGKSKNANYTSLEAGEKSENGNEEISHSFSIDDNEDDDNDNNNNDDDDDDGMISFDRNRTSRDPWDPSSPPRKFCFSYTLGRAIQSSGLGIVIRDRGVMVSILSFSVFGCIYVVIDEVFPLWALTPLDKGGLHFSSSQIGLSWTIGGISLVIYQAFIYFRLAQKFGPLKCLRVSAVILAFGFLCYPLVGVISRWGYDRNQATGASTTWISLGFVIIIRTIAGNTTGTGFQVMLNSQGGERVQRFRGVVNGLSVSFVGLARSFGPSLGGILFAWSSNAGHSFPFNYTFIFNLLCVLSLMTLSSTWLIRDLDT